MNIKTYILVFLLSLGYFGRAQNDSSMAVLVQSDLNIIAYLTENDSTTFITMKMKR
jgi:hypothetical protein